MKPLDCLEIYADAEFYEQEFAARGHEIPFFIRQAQSVKGNVLEVACGTGRITLPIARAGVEIVGLDISAHMLSIARRKSEAESLSITWIRQDCRAIDLTQKFALVFSATNAMQHLHDLASVNSFLNSARNALRSDGTLILDVFNPDLEKLARAPASRYHHKTFRDNEGNEITVEATSEYRSSSQILYFTLFYLSSGKLIRTKHVTMRCFYPEELLALCRFSGLEVLQRFGDYDESAFTDRSPKQILICRKTD